MLMLKVKNLLISFLLLVLLNLRANESAKILGLVPFPCKSHSILGSTLLKALASRGHDVTMISSFPLDRPPHNYRDVYVDIEKSRRAHRSNVQLVGDGYSFRKARLALECCTKVSEALLEDRNVKKFLAAGEKFDLVVTMGKDSLLGISHAVNATATIRFNMLEMHSIYSAYTMNPLPSSYVPNFLLPFSSNMHFLQRLTNTLMNLFFDLYIYHTWMQQEAAVVKKHFPAAPHLKELQQNVALTFVNSHFTVESIRPIMTNVVPIGGFHIASNPDELTEELKVFLDNSPEGVILFSMGSQMTSEVLQEKLNVTMKCFAKLAQKVLWKSDTPFENQPQNVKSVRWLPQKAVLAHPNLKLFITHGGLGSLLESVYFGVPMLIMPMFLDQHKNAAQSAENGIAVHLNVEQLTEETLSDGIEEILTNPKYREEVKVRSFALRNQEVDPMEKALYWIEHVLKYPNANHFKNKAQQMPLYQYYLIDVFAAVLVGFGVVVSVFWLFAKKFFGFCRKVFSGRKKVTKLE